jgi:hypothetical protein
MTTIDPHQRFAAALRDQLSALRQRGEAQRLHGGNSAAPQAERAASGSSHVMAQRIRSIDPADPDRRQKAVRVFLESELAREFGAVVLNDSAFPAMLDAVQQQMQQDAGTAAAVQAVGELLLSDCVAP